MGVCGTTENKNLEKKRKGLNKNSQIFYSTINVNELNTQAKQQIQLFLVLKNSINTTEYEISCILYDNKNKKSYKDGGTTEASFPINGTINFSKFFICEYYFEKEQPLLFKVRKNTLEEIPVETTIGAIMGSRGQILTRQLSSGEILEISGRGLENSNLNLNFNLSLSGANNKSYFFIIKSLGTSAKPGSVNLYKSEIKESINDILFEQTSIPIKILSSEPNFEDSLIGIDLYEIGFNSPIGAYKGTIRSIMNKSIDINTKNYDLICTLKTNICKNYTFLDYLRGGMQIALTIAIDFTASNLPPTDSKSLHNLTMNGMNPYEKAIRACGDIVAYYDYDQLFPVYGYGAIIPNQSTVNHCFPLTMTQDPFINTIDGVLLQYRNILPTIRLYGPTNFAPVINCLNQIVANNVKAGNDNEYNILMILTDGQICDMDDTIDALVVASKLPISVIIIGIGYEDFSNMVVLDADDNPLYDRKGEKASRDLVQFVPFNEFNGDADRLAAEVLEEIPRQVVEYYFKLNGKRPNDPIIQIAGQ